MNSSNSCHLCGSANTTTFFDLPPVPTMDGVMSATKHEALNVPRGKVELQFCADCSFIQNTGYEQSKVSFDTYDFANDYSPLFSKFIKELAHRLIDAYDIRSKQILEVASGDGHFLRTICALGNNTGLGFDPGFSHEKSSNSDNGVRFIEKYYDERQKHLRPDLLVCRHLINLIDTSKQFVQMIRRNLEESRDTLVYIEVPNAEYTFREKIYWNVGYEHGAWFTCTTLSSLMEICHFEVLDVFTCWNDEFIGVVGRPVEAKPREDFKISPNGIHEAVNHFSTDYLDLLSNKKRELMSGDFLDKKVVAWGAGARAVTYFNVLETNGTINYIVDININRQGKFLPG
ncbi:MAG: methyltransferase domain-containing protein, partial [Saprospiraceae bacterium]|nr:methyltransferase domain-containing protein [Saprospiraceae bacterium]